MTDKTVSACCKAQIKVAHGCDSDSGHGGKPCTCTDGTQWYECTKCGNPCDSTPTHSPNTECPHCGSPYLPTEGNDVMGDDGVVYRTNLSNTSQNCGCVKGKCSCDPMRVHPPVCCKDCPTNPPEPTVEKWERNYPYEWNKHFYSKGGCYDSEPHYASGDSACDETLVEVRGSELSKFISSSVQEAKAEEREKLKELIESSTFRYIKGGELRTQYYAKGYNDFRKDVLDLLTSLRKEREKI